MRDFARRQLSGSREYEVLVGEALDKPGFIRQPNGVPKPTSHSVASVLKGYGWEFLKTKDEQIRDLWRG
jgi:hypothetical protein